MLKMRAGGWGQWKSGKGYKRWGTGGGSCECRAWAHTISMATVWSFSLWLSGLQHTWWRSGQVVLMTRGGEVNRRGEGGGCLDQRQRLVPPVSALSLSPPQTLPSADPKSCFDWISHELMRQAWRTASVVEISYHILIRSLCERRVRLCDLMVFKKNEIKEKPLLLMFFFKAPNDWICFAIKV